MKNLPFHIIIYCLVAVLTPNLHAREEPPPPIEQDYAYLSVLYQDLHRNPELSLQEAQTSQRLAREWRQLGYQVTQNVGGHGVVAVLENGSGPTLMLRADMDALPVEEMTGLPYSSVATAVNSLGETVPVMHACGHDVHMTVLVGTARQLLARRADWQGTVVLVAQPAEEIGAGARSMLADDLFSRFPRPDYNLALHVSAELPAGHLGYISGYAMANVDSVDITVRGIGGHGAYPHKTKDPILMAAEIVLQLQTIISREISPLESAVITVGSIHGGSKHNVISDQVDMQLTVRSYSDETRDFLLRRIREISEGVARTAGLGQDKLPVVTVRDEYTPAVYNDPAFTDSIVTHLQQTLGPARLVAVPPVMAGEDFARYGRIEPKIPSALLWLGAVDPAAVELAASKGESLPSLHSASFAPLPEPTITTGVQALTDSALYLLKK